MGQRQAYKRRHPGRRGQISAQEYTRLTFRWIAAARAEGEDSRGQAAGNKASQDRPGHTAARARTDSTGTDSTGTVRQGRPWAEHRDRRTAWRHSRSGTHTTHSRQSHTARRASEAAEGRGRPGARQHGAQVQRTTLLNMRHTETSNCAIVVAWQESERGRARQGSTPAHQLVERDSREAVSFVLPSDAYASRPPGQRGAA